MVKLELMLDTPFVFLDIETTGGSPNYSRITEIGAVRVENGAITQEYSQLLQPEQAVPGFITRLTGITDEMLWDAPRFADIRHELDLLLDGALFVAHNVNFDYSFIKAEYANIGERFDISRFCTARLSRKLYPAQGRHNLDTVIKAHGIEIKDRHRALDDAKALHEFYKSALQEHGDRVHAEIQRLIIPVNPLFSRAD
jgi:DNA polymerase-3 subunit epsilon